MTGAGIAVQLASERKTHSVAFLQIRDLLIGQSPDRAAFHPGIGLLLGQDGTRRCVKCHETGGREQPKDQSSLHVSASFENPHPTLAAYPCPCAWPCMGLFIIRSMSGPPVFRNRHTSSAVKTRKTMFSQVV